MNLSDLCRFQTEEIRLKTGKIREDLQQEGAGMGSDAVQHALLIYAFEGAFAERGILWKGTQEVYNRSPYCLKEELWEQAQQHLWISRPQTAGGRRLLVFYEPKAAFGVSGCRFAVIADVTDLERSTRQLFFSGLGIACVLLLLTGAVLCRSIFRTVRPLMTLRQAAVQIAGGAYESRAIVSGKDEIAQVTRSFNQMAGQVQEHMARLEDANEKQRQLLVLRCAINGEYSA